MGERILRSGELQQLARFIVTRAVRFAAPLMLPLEILDHFTCKTEELLDEAPGLSLDEAMHKVRQSFSVIVVHRRLMQKMKESKDTTDRHMKIIS